MIEKLGKLFTQFGSIVPSRLVKGGMGLTLIISRFFKKSAVFLFIGFFSVFLFTWLMISLISPLSGEENFIFGGPPPEFKEENSILASSISGMAELISVIKKEETSEASFFNNNVADNDSENFFNGDDYFLSLNNPNTQVAKQKQPIFKRYISEKDLPGFKGYFSAPALGWNWGILHSINGVDIANQCGSPILAAAEGLVIESENGWNNGYGNYIKIQHPNGAYTIYSHNSKNLAEIGDYVDKGQKIALMGNTGKVKGETGCHVHFEVRGAKNPFAR